MASHLLDLAADRRQGPELIAPISSRSSLPRSGPRKKDIIVTAAARIAPQSLESASKLVEPILPGARRRRTAGRTWSRSTRWTGYELDGLVPEATQDDGAGIVDDVNRNRSARRADEALLRSSSADFSAEEGEATPMMK